MFDDEEPKYPDRQEVVEPEPDLDEFSDEEEDQDEKKNIPIIPIQKPLNRKTNPGSLKDDLPLNKENEYLNEEDEARDEIDDFSKLKDKKDCSLKINKQENIQDDSDEDLSGGEEEYEDENTKKDSEPTLF